MNFKGAILTIFLIFLSATLAWAGDASQEAVPAAEPVQFPKLSTDFSYEFVKESTMKKDEIYEGAVLWITETFKSNKPVIDLKDKELGKIVGHGITRVDVSRRDLPLGDIGGAVYKPYVVSYKIDIKDNKYRITFSKVTDIDNKPTTYNEAIYEKKVHDRLAQLANELDAYLAKNKADSNF